MSSQLRFRQKQRQQTKCWVCPKRINSETSTSGPCVESKKWQSWGSFLHCCPAETELIKILREETVNSIKSSNGENKNVVS